MDPQEIADLNRGIERYNPNHIQELADYLEEQITKNIYDKDACLAILKLMQLSLEKDSVEEAHLYLYQDHNKPPEEIEKEFKSAWEVYQQVVFKVLIKGMMQMPRPDFCMMKSMIDVEYQKNEELIGWAILLHGLLDCCQFEKFWKEIAAVPERVSNFVGFHESIRTYVCYAVTKTFQNVPTNLVKRWLGLNSGSADDNKEFEEWVAKNKWQVQDDQIFCSNLDDRVKSKKITESLSMNTPGMQDVLANGVTKRGLKSGK